MLTWRRKMLVLSGICGSVAIKVGLAASSLCGWAFSLMSLILACLFFHIWSLSPADNLSLAGLTQAYMEMMIARILGGLALRRFKKHCENVHATQRDILFRLLRAGKMTAFGRDHKLAEITSVDDFQSRIPISVYEDYKPYIDRCLEGEDNVFFKQKVNYFAATSGTTSGKSKYYPVNTSETLKWVTFPFVMAMKSFGENTPGMYRLKFMGNVWTPGKVQKTDNGIEKGSVTTKMLRYQAQNCSPREAYQIYDEHSGYYVHMLFMLRERDLGFFITMTSSVLLMLMSMVEHNWERLVRDIRRGELDYTLDIPNDIRTVLNKTLTPSPERADELETIFRSGFSEMVPRIWPNLVAISTISTGTFALQARVVQDLYLGPRVPIICFLHMSTEGMYGHILYDQGIRNPETGEVIDEYTIASNVNFYEFIPADKTEEKQPNTLLAHQVQVGHDYEMVVTTYRGLYRYRTGDLVRIVGYRGNTPKYRVLQRVGYVLNVHLEKLPESVLCEAVETAASQLKTGKVINFVATENVNFDKIKGTTSENVYYVLFLETDSNKPLSEEEKLLMDKELCRLSDTYRAYRNKGTISPPRVIQVQTGAFAKIRDWAANRNPLLYKLQYKHPRIIRDTDRLNILINNQI